MCTYMYVIILVSVVRDPVRALDANFIPDLHLHTP